jgi:hypothetical protein
MTYFFTLNQYGGSNKLSPGQAIKVLLPTQTGNAGKVLSTDGSTLSWTSFSGGGITSLNGLTAAVQAFAVGTSGTDFNVVSALTTHTFNLPVASATNTGKLSSADWSTFNGKQNAIGFTPEDVANKSTSTSLGTSNTLYPSQNAVKTYVDAAVASANPASAKLFNYYNFI